jgi:ribosome-binding protein aMBF1 (putative translation factor)
LVHEGEAMMFERSPFPYPPRQNRQRRAGPVEPLSARIVRLRLARGYSVYELAKEAGVFAGAIRCLESGEPADKRVLSALVTALGVPLCRLVCGDHRCAERACVPARSVCAPPQQGQRAKGRYRT